MQPKELRIENKVLQSWKLRIALLMAIISPAITATGAYYNLKSDIKDSVSQVQEKIDYTYVRKDSVETLKEDVRDVKSDVREIKNLLIKRGR